MGVLIRCPCVNKKFLLNDLLRQLFCSPFAGYEDLNDAVRVSAHTTFRLISSLDKATSMKATM